MSRQRRNFTAKFKSDLVIQLLRAKKVGQLITHDDTFDTRMVINALIEPSKFCLYSEPL